MRSRLEDLPIELKQGELVTRYVEWGDMAIRYAHVPAGTDITPVLEGLPGDRCPSEHWGLVLSGALTLIHDDGTTELTSAGEAYHWRAGHTAKTDEGAVFLEVGPTETMRAFGDHAKAKPG
ncbi:MAG: hypothetical protein ACRD2C_17630 [Acidimicrobiales bacterium]